VEYGEHRAVWRVWYVPAALVALGLAYLVGHFHIALTLVISLYFTWLFFADRISGWLLPFGWFFAFTVVFSL